MSDWGIHTVCLTHNDKYITILSTSWYTICVDFLLLINFYWMCFLNVFYSAKLKWETSISTIHVYKAYIILNTWKCRQFSDDSKYRLPTCVTPTPKSDSQNTHTFCPCRWIFCEDRPLTISLVNTYHIRAMIYRKQFPRCSQIGF